VRVKKKGWCTQNHTLLKIAIFFLWNALIDSGRAAQIKAYIATRKHPYKAVDT